jgi:hypothetical protein
MAPNHLPVCFQFPLLGQLIRTCLLLVLILTVACTQTIRSVEQPYTLPIWNYTDLRVLDPVDAASPTHDLVAAYSQINANELQLRLEWLDHPTVPDYDLYVALDTAPGGSTTLPIAASPAFAWDALLVIRSGSSLQVLDAHLAPLSGIAMHVLRETSPDTLEIGLNRKALRIGPSVQVQAFVTSRNRDEVEDAIGPFDNDGFPPPAVPVLFAFWDTYPAYTPALALRRWDGAHTGPLGGRHGLYNLLRTAQASNMPLVLLDLKVPDSLAALQFAGRLAMVQDFIQHGSLLLPEFLPGFSSEPGTAQDWYLQKIIDQNQEIVSTYNLPPTLFAYSPGEFLPSLPKSRYIFQLRRSDQIPSSMLETIQPFRRGEQVILTIPDGITAIPQAAPEGPTLELRRALIQAALQQPNQPAILILGGALPGSAWGDPQSARATFHYLSERPWIRPLDAQNLYSFPAQGFASQETSPTPASPYQPALQPSELDRLLQGLSSAPNNPIGQAAWQAFLSLYNPVFPAPAELPALRAVYIGQVWSLIHAADWATSPIEIADCTRDPDQDGEPECILANDRLYAQFEIESGSLSLLLEPAQQWVGPSSQIITGLSDSFTWRLDRGLAADPAIFPGAFADPGGAYHFNLQTRSLAFESADGLIQKTFSLSENSLEVMYHFEGTPPFSSLALPVFYPPWNEKEGWQTSFPQGNEQLWCFTATPPGSTLVIRQNAAPLTLRSFLAASPEVFSFSEDPNREYPPGHFLPFSLSVIDLTITGDFEVRFEFLSP